MTNIGVYLDGTLFIQSGSTQNLNLETLECPKGPTLTIISRTSLN